MERNQLYESLNRAYFGEEPHEKKTLECLPTILRQARVFVDVGASLGLGAIFLQSSLIQFDLIS
ncbi:hypothetical protein ES703_34295 [subsurface metagenome]